MLQQQEAERLQREAKKTNCAATDRFWVESEGKCDGRRTATGERRGEAYACEEQGNFWDSDFGYKFCNKLLDVDGKPKSGKEFCSSNNQYWDGSKCDPTKNLDGSPKLYADVCQDLGMEYIPRGTKEVDLYGKRKINEPQSSPNTCNPDKDTEGNPINEERLCLDSVSYYKDGKCDYKKFPNGADKPEAMIDTIRHHRNGIQIPYDKASLMERFQNITMNGAINNQNWDDFGRIQNDYNQQREKAKKEAAIEKAKDVLGLFNVDYAISKGFVPGDPRGQSFWNDWTEAQRNMWIDNQNIQWLTDWYPWNMEGTPGIKANLTPAEQNEYRGDFSRAISLYTKKDTSGVYEDPEFMNALRPFFSRPSKPKPKGNGRGGNKPATLTLHWADWCPHCHDMMPEWKKLGSNHNGVIIQAVEQKQSGFKGPFPTILFQHGNSMEKYEGPRTKAAFTKFLKNKLG
jgi:thiol-disulfide isomerase/thioredoxin